jgi:hypothetical protein
VRTWAGVGWFFVLWCLLYIFGCLVFLLYCPILNLKSTHSAYGLGYVFGDLSFKFMGISALILSIVGTRRCILPGTKPPGLDAAPAAKKKYLRLVLIVALGATAAPLAIMTWHVFGRHREEQASSPVGNPQGLKLTFVPAEKLDGQTLKIERANFSLTAPNAWKWASASADGTTYVCMDGLQLHPPIQILVGMRLGHHSVQDFVAIIKKDAGKAGAVVTNEQWTQSDIPIPSSSYRFTLNLSTSSGKDVSLIGYFTSFDDNLVMIQTYAPEHNEFTSVVKSLARKPRVQIEK